LLISNINYKWWWMLEFHILNMFSTDRLLSQVHCANQHQNLSCAWSI
jgi:hypothetical protein